MKFTAVAILATYAAAVSMEAETAEAADAKDQVVYEDNQWVDAYAKTTDLRLLHKPHWGGYGHHQPWGYGQRQWGYGHMPWGTGYGHQRWGGYGHHQPWGYGQQRWGGYGGHGHAHGYGQQPAKVETYRKDYGLRSYGPQKSPFNGWVAEAHPNMRLLKTLGRAPQYDVNTWEKASCIDEDWGLPEPEYDCADGKCGPAAYDCADGKCGPAAYDCKDGSCEHDYDCRECGTVALSDGACGSALAGCRYGDCKDGDCEEWSDLTGRCGYGVPSQVPARADKEKERRAWWQPTTTVRPGAYRATYTKAPAYADAVYRRWGY